MTNTYSGTHNHIFLGEGHTRNERRTWMVIGLCSFMMVAEIVGGVLFGSIALVADGLHMSTHASALLLAALAYSFARRHSSHATSSPIRKQPTRNNADATRPSCTTQRRAVNMA